MAYYVANKTVAHKTVAHKTVAHKTVASKTVARKTVANQTVATRPWLQTVASRSANLLAHGSTDCAVGSG